MNTRKIIIVDDDRLSVLITKSLLEKSGLNADKVDIHTFLYPKEALIFLENQSIEDLSRTLLLLDINMPIIDGFQFLDQLELKKISSLIQVIMLTSSIAYEDKEKAKSYSCVVDYFSKPLDFDKIKKIERLLETK